MVENANENTDNKWCFAWFAAPADTAIKRAGLLKTSKWQPGDVIKIAFLDGTDEQKSLVKKFAAEWTAGLANLTFSWIADAASSHVRITFQYPGSWSVIGTTCTSVPKDQPTMNFGWLTPGVADDEARRVIVHEFGHAIGLIHEHQRMPADGWNKQAVIADLSGPPNNWDAETIQHNMFDTYSAEEINGSKLDPTSIMMYPIPKSWRTDGLSAGLNTDLSATDRTFIKKVYS